MSAFIDALGREHPQAGSDARIVSLVPSLTELLFVLGLGGQVVGRTSFCIHPRSQVAAVLRVGGTKKVHVQRLRALQPSHVIVNVDENTRETAAEIAGFVANVVVTHPLEPRDNLGLFRLLGGIFGRAREAQTLARRFESEYDRVTAAARPLPRRKVLYLIWRDPWMTVSHDTYISRTLALVNWETVGHRDDTRYPVVEPGDDDLEGTDLVLFSSEPYPFKPKHLTEFAETFRLEGSRSLSIDGELVSWYGSRAIRGLRYLRELAG